MPATGPRTKATSKTTTANAHLDEAISSYVGTYVLGTAINPIGAPRESLSDWPNLAENKVPFQLAGPEPISREPR